MRTARLCDATTGQPRGELLRHEKPIMASAFSPDGATAATASLDGTARLWDAASGRPLLAPLTHPDIVMSVAFSPDGKTILTGCVDTRARLWNVATGQSIGPSLPHQGGVLAAVFSPDGKTILSAGMDGRASFWNAATGASQGQPLLHRSWIRSVVYSPDGSPRLDRKRRRRGAALGRDHGTARRPGHDPSPQERRRPVHRSQTRPSALTARPSSAYVEDRTARVWSIARPSRNFDAHARPPRSANRPQP